MRFLSSQRSRVLFLAALAGIAGLAWWWPQDAPPPPVAAAPDNAVTRLFSGASAPDGAPYAAATGQPDPLLAPAEAAAASPSQPAAMPPAVAANIEAPPSDEAPTLSLRELLEIKAQMAAQPNADPEFNRAADQMLFADAVQRFRSLRLHGGDATEQRGLAQLIDSGMEAGLQQQTLPLDEAQALKAELLAVQLGDAAARQAAWQRWLLAHRLNGNLPLPAAAGR